MSYGAITASVGIPTVDLTVRGDEIECPVGMNAGQITVKALSSIIAHRLDIDTAIDEIRSRCGTASQHDPYDEKNERCDDASGTHFHSLDVFVRRTAYNVMLHQLGIAIYMVHDIATFNIRSSQLLHFVLVCSGECP